MRDHKLDIPKLPTAKSNPPAESSPSAEHAALRFEFLGIDSEGRADIRVIQIPYIQPYREVTEFIARAANSHQALLEACKHVLAIDNFTELDSVHYDGQSIKEILQAAIQLAEKPND